MKKILIIIICIGVVIFAGVIAIGFLVEHDRQATLTESAEQAAEQAWIDLNGQKDFYEAALEASESGHMTINEAARYLIKLKEKGLTNKDAIVILGAQISQLAELKASRPAR